MKNTTFAAILGGTMLALAAMAGCQKQAPENWPWECRQVLQATGSWQAGAQCAQDWKYGQLIDELRLEAEEAEFDKLDPEVW